MRSSRTLTLAALLAVLVMSNSGAATAKRLTDWGNATVVANVDAPAVADGCPIESPDGTQLYIASKRGLGGVADTDQDIWVASRPDETSDFGAPTILPSPVNSDADDFCPTPLRGGYLLFVSTRGGTDAYGTTACGAGGDIYLTRQSPATGAWEAPRNLGCAPTGPNLASSEFGPSVVETDDGTILFFSSGGAPGSNTQDIYMSWQRPDGSFGPATAVAELNTASDDMMPNVSKDGRELVLASNRAGGAGGFDIWSTTRASVDDPWSAPVDLGPAVNGTGGETRPSLSWDGERLYFGRDGVIYVSHRSMVTGP